MARCGPERRCLAVILTMDIGNGAIVLCCVEQGERRSRFVLSSSLERTADEYAVLMDLMARSAGVELRQVSGSIMASVVPRLTPVISRAVEQLTGRPPLVVGPGVRSGLNIRMDDPTELGGDMVAAAVAALERYPLPCAVVDMGTATAIGVLDRRGSYVGGLICPGMALSSSSLAEEASQLQDVSLEAPRRIIGKNTRDSMRSGILYGTAAMLDGLFARIEEELGAPLQAVITGDGAADVVSLCRHQSVVHDEDLVMRGLWRIYCKNKTERKEP